MVIRGYIWCMETDTISFIIIFIIGYCLGRMAESFKNTFLK